MGSVLSAQHERINKTEILQFELTTSLNTAVSTIQEEEGKQIVTTSDNSINSIGSSSNMPSCNQEEANIHDAIHALNGIYPGFQKMVIQTIDTDVIVVLVHHFKNVQTLNENVKFFCRI